MPPRPVCASGRPGAPLVSAVLGSYNRGHLLPRALDGVRAELAALPGGAGAGEVIVVDGGSTDGGLEWLCRQGDVLTLVQRNRPARRGQKAAGRSWGHFMNLAFRAARGHYLLMLSDDCLLVKGALARGLQAAEQARRRGLTPGGVAFYYRDWPGERDYYVQETLGGRLMVNHGLLVRPAVQAVGWVDEGRYRFYKADGDLCLRLWQAGYAVVAAPGAFVEHHHAAGEAVRRANNATLAADRAAYHARWAGLCGPLAGRPARRLAAWADPGQTALSGLPARAGGAAGLFGP